MAIISIGIAAYGSEIMALRKPYAAILTSNSLQLRQLKKTLYTEITQTFVSTYGTPVTTYGKYNDSTILAKSTPTRYAGEIGVLISGLRQVSYQFWS